MKKQVSALFLKETFNREIKKRLGIECEVMRNV